MEQEQERKAQTLRQGCQGATIALDPLVGLAQSFLLTVCCSSVPK